MNKKIIAIILIILILAFTGCTDQQEKTNDIDKMKFVGIWESEEVEGMIIYKIYENRTLSGFAEGIRFDYNVSGTWDVEGDQFFIYSNLNDTFPYTYEFTNDYNNLILTWELTGRAVNLTKTSDLSIK